MASRDDVAGVCVALGTGERRFDAYPTRDCTWASWLSAGRCRSASIGWSGPGAFSIGSARSAFPPGGRWTWRRIRTSACRR